MGFAIAFSLQVKDLGSFGEAVNDGVSHGVIMKSLVPFSEGLVGGDGGGAPGLIALGEDLEDQVAFRFTCQRFSENPHLWISNFPTFGDWLKA